MSIRCAIFGIHNWGHAEDTGSTVKEEQSFHDFWDPYGGDMYYHAMVDVRLMARCCTRCGIKDIVRESAL